MDDHGPDRSSHGPHRSVKVRGVFGRVPECTTVSLPVLCPSLLYSSVSVSRVSLRPAPSRPHTTARSEGFCHRPRSVLKARHRPGTSPGLRPRRTRIELSTAPDPQDIPRCWSPTTGAGGIGVIPSRTLAGLARRPEPVRGRGRSVGHTPPAREVREYRRRQRWSPSRGSFRDPPRPVHDGASGVQVLRRRDRQCHREVHPVALPPVSRLPLREHEGPVVQEAVQLGEHVVPLGMESLDHAPVDVGLRGNRLPSAPTAGGVG